jgi:hypothetical protein
MDEEYPAHGGQGQGQGQDQDLDSERIGPGAPADGEEPRLPAHLPSPLHPPPTGDDRVDQAVAGLGRLAGAPAEEHVAVLEEVHGRLRDVLGELSEDTP